MSDSNLNSRIAAIAEKIRRAQELACEPFGVESHGFNLYPPLPEEKIAAFEKSRGIILPADYRAFIGRIGNGGAGPAYGMFALGAPAGDYLRTAFPHVEKYNPAEDPEIEKLYERAEHDPLAEAELERRKKLFLAGTIPLCDEGCGYEHFLVITGPARGQMWIDGQVSDGGFAYLGADFVTWYERWIDQTLAGESGCWWLE